MQVVRRREVNIRYKPLLEEFLLRVTERLAPEGFTRRQQAFWRDLGDVAWGIHFAVIPHRDDFDMTCDFAVRHHAVQEVLRQRIYPTLSSREFRETATVGAELGNYATGRQLRWTICSVEDVTPVLTQFDYWYTEHIRYYLDSLSSLEDLRSDLVANDKHALLLCPLPGQRQGVIDAIAEVLAQRAV